MRLWRPAAAAWAALFFSIHEGHQEAVMWFSAINELWMLAFGLASLWCGLRRRIVTSTVLFGFALLSKESAVVLPPLFLLAGGWRRSRQWLPHGVLVALAIASIVQSHSNSFRFADGSFSLAAPFWITWPRCMARLLWFWGWATVVTVWAMRDPIPRRDTWHALAWMGIAPVPYSFLTYSTEIPSRPTYLASAGLAAAVGLAGSCISDRRVMVAVIAAMLVHIVGYLWTKKRWQFLERSAPTTELIAFARRTSGSIRVPCFPLPRIVVEEAVRLGADRSSPRPCMERNGRCGDFWDSGKR